MSCVVSPSFEHRGHIVWDGAFEVHVLSCCGVFKAEYEGMECLAGQQAEVIFDKLLIA